MARWQVPTWIYGAIASGLGAILVLFWNQLAPLDRLDLLLPALFWTGAWAVIGWRRAHRS
ncbi:MAG TPA: hypothetical protein VG942_09485 [Hyphomonadaceae bacterium]|nr:hypothetical protein [Hyphomonadaceae bacterium]